jgi:hypothetical protein
MHIFFPLGYSVSWSSILHCQCISNSITKHMTASVAFETTYWFVSALFCSMEVWSTIWNVNCRLTEKYWLPGRFREWRTAEGTATPLEPLLTPNAGLYELNVLSSHLLLIISCCPLVLLFHSHLSLIDFTNGIRYSFYCLLRHAMYQCTALRDPWTFLSKKTCEQ